MVRHPEKYVIEIDLDRDRIRTVLHEAYRSCRDMLGVEFTIEEDAFVAKIEPFLASNRTTLPVQINLPSRKYPELIIEVNLRKKSVFARMSINHIQANLNHYLKSL